MTIPTQEWVHFTDDKGQEWAFDVIFLLSRWGCIFGNGCKGAFKGDDGKAHPEHGCCGIGAHLSEDRQQLIQERANINRAIRLMDDSEFRNAKVAKEIRKGWEAKNGNSIRTRILGDVCIFANDESSPNGPGCSLHQAALARGERIQDWKPDVCTWAPLFEFTGETDLIESTEVNVITRFENRYWSGDYDTNVLDWWCIDDADAYREEHQPVYIAYRLELISRIGAKLYAQLAEHLRDRLNSVENHHDYSVAVSIGRRDFGGINPLGEEDEPEEVEETPVIRTS